MVTSSFEEYLLGEVERGEMILVEYSSRVPIEEIAWDMLAPAFMEKGDVVVVDFLGVGSLLFKNYERKLPGKDYSKILELMKRLKVIKVGPSTANYGEVIETLVPSDDSKSFLKNYHTLMNRIAKLPSKPEYMLVFGFAEHIYFGGEAVLKNLFTALATIPFEDWAVVAFINFEVLKPEQIALLEGISSAAFRVTKDGIEIRKVKKRGEGK
ncbi:DUF257 family protein [Thermococcus sp.]